MHGYNKIWKECSQVVGSPINCKTLIIVIVIVTGWFIVAGLLGLANTLRSSTTFNRPSLQLIGDELSSAQRFKFVVWGDQMEN